MHWLRNSGLSENFAALKVATSGFVLKLIDSSELHVFEYVGSSLHKKDYSYHWQDREKKTILRWDNAPHHPEIKTFPHHLHEEGGVKEAEGITFAEVLREIERRFKRP
jgi:hypothetical protein